MYEVCLLRDCGMSGCEPCERVEEALELVLAPPIVAFFRYIWIVLVSPIMTIRWLVIADLGGLMLGLCTYGILGALFGLNNNVGAKFSVVAGILFALILWVHVSVDAHQKHTKKVQEALAQLEKGLCFHYYCEGDPIKHAHFTDDPPDVGSMMKKYVQASLVPALDESWLWFLFSRKHLIATGDLNSEIVICDFVSASRDVTLLVRRLSIFELNNEVWFSILAYDDFVVSKKVRIHALPEYVRSYALIRASGGMISLADRAIPSHEVANLKGTIATKDRDLEEANASLLLAREQVRSASERLAHLKELVFMVSTAKWVVAYAVALSVVMRSEKGKPHSPHSATSRRVMASIFSGPAPAFEFLEKWVSVDTLAGMLCALSDGSHHTSHAKILDVVVDRLLAKYGINTRGEKIALSETTLPEVATPTPATNGSPVDPH